MVISIFLIGLLSLGSYMLMLRKDKIASMIIGISFGLILVHIVLKIEASQSYYKLKVEEQRLKRCIKEDNTLSIELKFQVYKYNEKLLIKQDHYKKYFLDRNYIDERVLKLRRIEL